MDELIAQALDEIAADGQMATDTFMAIQNIGLDPETIIKEAEKNGR